MSATSREMPTALRPFVRIGEDLSYVGGLRRLSELRSQYVLQAHSIISDHITVSHGSCGILRLVLVDRQLLVVRINGNLRRDVGSARLDCRLEELALVLDTSNV